MNQKKKIVAWRLIVLLSVFAGISLFAMSPVLARATDTNVNPIVIPIPTRSTVLLGIWRPDGSTVGSVRVTDQTNPQRLEQCVNLPKQDVIYGFGGINGQDSITIEHFAGADCQGTPGKDRDPSKTYTGQVNSLAPGSPKGNYRIYQTPKDA
jgi:hypothetical protein